LGVGPGELCLTGFFPQSGRLDDATECRAWTDWLVRAATAGEELPTAGTSGADVDMLAWPVSVAPGVGVELSVTVGDGETPEEESEGEALGLVPWICPGCEADGLAPDGLAGLHVGFALGPVELPEPRVDWPCTLVPPPLPWVPPPAPPPPPVERAAFEALGEIPCCVSIAMYVPAATMKTVTPRAAAGRSQPSVRAARPPDALRRGPKRSHARLATLRTSSANAWSAAGTRVRR
jgi:hypothetical protein